MFLTAQDPNLKLSLPIRIIIFILGFTDNLFFGGAIFGWPQLVYELKADGVFNTLCIELDSFKNETINQVTLGGIYVDKRHCQNDMVDFNLDKQAPISCPAQDARFALIYTIAVVCYGVPGVLVGYMLHYVGLRITRFLGGLMVTASFFCFALITQANPYWLFPATLLLSVGGNQVRMSNMQFGDLFPSKRSTTITVLSGVYAASASLFLLFSYGRSLNIPREYVCYGIAVFAFFSTVLSIVMPASHIPYHNTDSDEKQSKCDRHIPLMTSVKTMSSHLHLYWFCVILFVVNVYQQFYNVWVTESTCTEEEVGFYSTIFSYSNLICVFVAPLGGMFTDILVKRADKANSNNYLLFQTKEIQANFWPLLLTTIASLVMTSSVLFFHPIAVVVSLVSMIIVRPCVIAISTAYLRIRFPGSHFNRLLGIYCTIASILMYFQYPVFQWAQSNYYAAQGLIVGLTLLSLLNPLHLLFTSKIKDYVRQRDAYLNVNFNACVNIDTKNGTENLIENKA